MNSLNYFLGILFVISTTALVLAILAFTNKKGEGFKETKFCQMCAKDPNYDGGKCTSSFTNRCGYGKDPFLDACQNAGKLGTDNPRACTSQSQCINKDKSSPNFGEHGACVENAVCINQHTKGKCTGM